MWREHCRGLDMKRWLVAGVLVVLLLNLGAYRHAYLMTHFSAGKDRTRSPERLSAWDRLTVLVTGVKMPRPLNGPVPVGYRGEMVDGRLEVWVAEGTGPMVLMFPGHAVAKSSLLPEAELWRELGWRPVLVDFTGCGGSLGNVTTVGWREAEDVAAAVRWAGAPVVLYGQSMGGAAVLRALAHERLPVERVVVECVFDRFVTTVGHRYQAMKLPAFPLARCWCFGAGCNTGSIRFGIIRSSMRGW
jgi:hypothetical protein